MNSDIDNNKVFLQGVVDTEPELNHSVKDEEFYSFDLRVARLSGQNDIVPIIISKKLIKQFLASLVLHSSKLFFIVSYNVKFDSLAISLYLFKRVSPTPLFGSLIILIKDKSSCLLAKTLK